MQMIEGEKVDIDNQIIEMFRARGIMIESGSQFSARGQISQLLDVVKPIIAERDEALEKLAAMESQPPVLIVGSEDFHEDLRDLTPGEKLYAKPVPADNPARITEQDAREIAISVMRYCHEISNWYPDAWREDRGRELLNKLNADREQVPAVAVHDRFNGDDQKLVECAISLLNLDAKGALTPHELGGHARTIIESFVSRSDSPQSQKSADNNIWTENEFRGPPPVGYKNWYDWMLSPEKRFAYIVARPGFESIDRCPSHESEQGGDQ